MRTIWMNDEQLQVIGKALDNINDDIALSVKRELHVAKFRASSSRVLVKSFLSVMGKKDKTPLRFNEEEFSFILKTALEQGIKEEDLK
jgi:hypothetical protein